MLVKATKSGGFIYGLYKNKGDQFTLVDVKTSDGVTSAKDQFSKNWMEAVEVEAVKKERKPAAKKTAAKKA